MKINLYRWTQKFIFHPEYFVLKTKTKCLMENLYHVSGTSLDIGCGDMVFKKLLEKRVKNYFGIDFPKTLKSSTTNYLHTQMNIAGRGEDLPIKKDSIDTFFLFDVLEHVNHPKLILEELKSALKSTGKIVITLPFFYPIHMQPFDYQRLTREGITTLANDLDYQVLELQYYGEPLQSLAVASNIFLFFHVFKLNALVKHPRSIFSTLIKVLIFPLALFLFSIINSISLILSNYYKNDSFPLGHLVILGFSAKHQDC